MASQEDANTVAFINLLKRNLPHYEAFSNGENKEFQAEAKQQPTKFEKNKEFVNKVEKCTEDEVYRSFVRLVMDFPGHKDVIRLDKEISALFKSTPELYIEFTELNADSWPGQNREDLGARTAPRKSLEWDKTKEDWEDQMCDSDMLSQFLESTKKATEKLGKDIVGEKGNNGINLEDYYSAMNLRCIKLIFGEYEAAVITALRKNPTAASSVLLRRLNTKLEEVGKWREEIRKTIAPPNT